MFCQFQSQCHKLDHVTGNNNIMSLIKTRGHHEFKRKTTTAESETTGLDKWNPHVNEGRRVKGKQQTK